EAGRRRQGRREAAAGHGRAEGQAASGARLMTEIHATAIDSFNAGKWRIMRVTKPGSFPVSTKAGIVDMPFNPGDVLLADANDRIICGPVSLDGAVELASRILDNDARAKTDPLASLILS